MTDSKREQVLEDPARVLRDLAATASDQGYFPDWETGIPLVAAAIATSGAGIVELLEMILVNQRSQADTLKCIAEELHDIANPSERFLPRHLQP
jgi:hypothetical protein